MIDPRLSHICRLIDAWCDDQGIKYDIICDETDLQSIMLFNRDSQTLNNLLIALRPSIAEGNISVKTNVVRGGLVLTFSLKALTEKQFRLLLQDASVNLNHLTEAEQNMSFRSKINMAFDYLPVEMPVTEKVTQEKTDIYIDFNESARTIVKEAQRKTANTAAFRGSLRDNSINNLNFQSTKGASRGAARGSKKGSSSHESANDFKHSLSEALDGLATSDGQQPGDLFKVFARALRVLGNKMGIGPLQDRLKEQGISWKQSDDGQSIILTIKNASTKLDQPIASINYETLQNPNDFEVQLKNMLDLATGQAPGSFNQQEKEIQDRKRTMKDIAQAIKPLDQEGEVAKLMNQGMGQEEAAQAAAQTAAMPK